MAFVKISDALPGVDELMQFLPDNDALFERAAEELEALITSDEDGATHYLVGGRIVAYHNPDTGRYALEPAY